MTLINGGFLVFPALEKRFWAKLPSLASGLAGVIIDLEDSIYAAAKADARKMVLANAEVLRALKLNNPELQVYLRINNSATSFFKKDIPLARRLVISKLIDGVCYPKVGSASDLSHLYRVLKTGKTPTKLFLAIETLEGYSNYKALIAPELGVRYVVIGAEDLCADMGLARPRVFYDNPLLNHIAVTVSLQAQLKEVSFLGNVWPYLSKSKLLPCFLKELAADFQVGAAGKIIFHPYQIEFVNKALTAELHGRYPGKVILSRISALQKHADDTGLYVVVHDGRMVDMPEKVRFNKWREAVSEKKTKSVPKPVTQSTKRK